MTNSTRQIGSQLGTRKSIQKEETRKIILESARVLFDELGFDKTSTRKIAEKGGVGIGTVFSHFPDKSSLLIAALLDDIGSTQEEALQTMPDGASVCEKFLHLARCFYSYYVKRPELSRTLLKGMFFVKGEWGDKLLSNGYQFVSLVGNLLEEAKRNGEIQSHVDTTLCATAFCSYYITALFQGLTDPQPNTEKMIDQLRCLINQLLHGVGSDGKKVQDIDMKQ